MTTTNVEVLDPEATATACCGPDCCTDTATLEQAPAAREAEATKALVREKYAAIATRETASCCGSDCGCGDGLSMIGDEYADIEGYVMDADLSLGCGLPTAEAGIRQGDTVLDLGCGAGLDAFIARAHVGEAGRIIGVDITPEMIDRAREHAGKLGYDNVDFVLGDIEALPLDAAQVDVVISNCVLNLVPNKGTAFDEMHRVLRPGGHFTISDVVYEGEMPEAVRRSAELYAGCVAGAMEKTAYLDVIREAGFRNVAIVKQKEIAVPDETLLQVMSRTELAALRRSGSALLSVTVRGEVAAS